MAAQETGKQRASRIPLDYYKRADRLECWKLGLGGLALFASLAWVGVHLVTSDEGDFQASRGPVAAVHQMWENQCTTCHVPFTPISSRSWSAPFLGDAAESSRRCQACHAGPDHHAGQKPDLACGTCHRDHQGRGASLVHLADSDCTQCHDDLRKHRAGGEAKFQVSVARFAENTHPPFRSIKTDTGRLKFNHQWHLTPGLAPRDEKGNKGGTIQTLGDIPEPYRERYRAQQEDKQGKAPVQLQCASCHQLDAGDFGVKSDQVTEFPFTLLGQRNAGAYFLPISYENQCRACHPLTLEYRVPAEPKAGELTIPHRLNPKETHELLRDFFTAQLARQEAGLLDKKVRPLPGKLPDLLGPAIRDEIHKRTENAEKDLYLSKRLCAECHYFDAKDKGIPAAIQTGKPPALHMEPTRVPQVWFQHARFDHTAHRAVKCAECHTKTETSALHSDVLIPDRDTCVKCHAPTTKTGSAGARFHCTECHSYHNGGHSLQGIGAARRDPHKKRTLDEFLSGKQ